MSFKSQLINDSSISELAKDLLNHLLELDIHQRYNFFDIIKHKWFKDNTKPQNIQLFTNSEKQIKISYLESLFYNKFSMKKNCKIQNSSFNTFEIRTFNKQHLNNSTSLEKQKHNNCSSKTIQNTVTKKSLSQNNLIQKDNKSSLNKNYSEVTFSHRKMKNHQRRNEFFQKEIIKRNSFNPSIDRKNSKINMKILEIIESYGFPQDYIIESMNKSERNHVTSTYFLLLNDN